MKQEQNRKVTCWGIDTRPSIIDIMENVSEACSCTNFKLSNSLALGIIRVYRVDTCKLLFTKYCINIDRNRLSKGKERWNNKIVLLNMNMYAESKTKWLIIVLWNICVTNYHEYLPLVVSTSGLFPHWRLITGFVTRLTRRVPLVEQELLSLLEFTLGL